MPPREVSRLVPILFPSLSYLSFLLHLLHTLSGSLASLVILLLVLGFACTPPPKRHFFQSVIAMGDKMSEQHIPSSDSEKNMDDIEKVPNGTSHNSDVDVNKVNAKERAASFVPPTPEEEKKVIWKLDRRLMPIVFTLYMLSVLDRSNLGNARLAGMEDGTL